MKNLSKVALLIILCLSSLSCHPDKIDNPRITGEELYDHISFLASDSLKGRGTGTPEGRVAAEFIASQLMDFGWEAFDKDPFQLFEVVTEVEVTERNTLVVDGKAYILHEDFIPLSYSASKSHTGEVTFCGYGFDIQSEDLVWNDFEPDLKGKWAMILLGDPEPDNPDSDFIPFSRVRSKVINARDHGAAGVLLVAGPGFDEKDELTVPEVDQTGADPGIPVFHIRRTVANRILEGSGNTIAGLELKTNALLRPVSVTTTTTVEGSAEVLFNRANTQNVVVWMEGADPVLKNEYIVLGGHYDHLGTGGSNSSSRMPDTVAVHHGADDNASGIASMIETGEYLASIRDTLKRSMILVAFGAEEIGILGSGYFVSNPPVDLSLIKAMINLDMIGRLKSNGELLAGGVGTSVEGEDLLNRLLGDRDLTLAFSYNGFGPSDHAAFYAEGIPVFFFSTGAHEDYHTPEDIVEKINLEGLKAVTEYVADLAVSLINRETALTFQEAGPRSSEKSGRRPEVKLGIMPNFGGSEVTGLRIDGVTPGSPAGLAGMKKGDVIVAISGKPVANIYEYMERMSRLKPGMTITVDVIRDGQKEVKIVQLTNG